MDSLYRVKYEMLEEKLLDKVYQKIKDRFYLIPITSNYILNLNFRNMVPTRRSKG